MRCHGQPHRHWRTRPRCGVSPGAQARVILDVIGSGETTFVAIGRQAGIQQASLNRALKTLTHKRIVAAETPLSTKPSKETRYRVADPHLRLWLTFLGPGFAEIERGRGDRVLARIQTSWESWRGRSVEPMIREGIDRLGAPALDLGDIPAPVVGGYWTRTNDVEIDFVLADRGPVAQRVLGVGLIKWREREPFNMSDYAALARHRDQVPGATQGTPVLAVSRIATTIPGVTVLTPADLIAAWGCEFARCGRTGSPRVRSAIDRTGRGSSVERCDNPEPGRTANGPGRPARHRPLLPPRP